MMTMIVNAGRAILRDIDQFLADFGFAYIVSTQGSAAAHEWQEKWSPQSQRTA
jgi:outer membrane biogenesis lipoprotein LolB